MKNNKILIFDTSVLCCWFKVPGKETCGPETDSWNHSRISELVKEEQKKGALLVLPVASIIETGNHIAQAKGNRYDIARALAAKMKDAADEKSPWAAFEHQSDLWIPEKLKVLADNWPELAARGIGIGDATIKDRCGVLCPDRKL